MRKSLQRIKITTLTHLLVGAVLTFFMVHSLSAGCDFDVEYNVSSSSCGASDASICFTINGGSGPFSISGSGFVSNNGTPSSFDFNLSTNAGQNKCANDLPPSAYTLTISDNVNCDTTFVLNVPVSEGNIEVDASASDVTACNVNSGEVFLDVNGGTPPYTIWAGNMGYGSSNSNGEIRIIELGADTYDFMISDANGCQAIETVTIGSPADAISAISSVNPSSSCTSFDGEICLSLTGGVAPYTISDGNFTYAVLGDGSNCIRDLSNGTYQWYITDANGCFVTIEEQVYSSSPLNIEALSVNGSSCTLSDDEFCLMLSGGSSPYTVAAGGFLNVEMTSGNSQCFDASSYPNQFTLSVTDNSNCVTTQIVNFNRYTLTLSIASITSASCGDNNGEVCINVAGANPPYQVQQITNSGTSIVGVYTTPGFCLDNLSAGVQDDLLIVGGGCTVPLVFDVGEVETEFSADVEVTATTSCSNNNGEICFTMTGANSPYKIYKGNSLLTTVSNSGQEACLDDYASGEYTFRIEDNTDCSIYETINVGSPADAIEVLFAIAPASPCSDNDGEICLNISGGTAPYSVSDNQGTTYPNFSEGTYICKTGLEAANYDIEIEDANGCMTVLEIELPNSNDSEELAFSFEVDDASCGQSNGEVCITISSGTPSYDIYYTSTDGGSASNTTFGEGLSQSSNHCVNTIAAGSYQFSIIDAAGCTVYFEATVGEVADDINVNTTTSAPSVCINGDAEICLTISGGNGPYAVYETGANYGMFAENTQRCLENLFGGVHELSIVDVEGCVWTESVSIGKYLEIVTVSTDCDGSPEVYDAFVQIAHNNVNTNVEVSSPSFATMTVALSGAGTEIVVIEGITNNGETTIDVTATVSGDAACNFTTFYEPPTDCGGGCAGGSCVLVKVKAFLQGPYNTGSGAMITTLADEGLLPNTQPYDGSPWEIDDSEPRVVPSNAVNWVLVEARDFADNFTVIETKAAFLLSDGSVVDAPGSEGINFSNLNSNSSYYIAIKARSHVGVIGSTPVVLPNTVAYDFSVPANVDGGTDQLIQASDGTYTMAAGDLNGDAVITIIDLNLYVQESSQFNGYFIADINMDRAVTISDYNFYTTNSSWIGVAQVRY